MDAADEVNKYINDKTPWKKDLVESVEIASTALFAFKVLSIYLSPIIPNITKDAFEFLNTDKNSLKDLNTPLEKTINNYTPLLNRLEPIELKKDKPMNEDNNIDIKHFAEVDLRVARIIEASNVEGADKLLKLNLDVGDLGKRQVFAGIKKAYSPEDLKDKLVILVSNLESRQMKFGISEGMVLASSDDEGIYLISPDSGAKPGLRVK
jgi:methionyl-tRNA synthetase